MMRHVLFLLINQLNAYLDTLVTTGTPPHVVAGNIGLSTTLGGNETYMDEKIVVSQINAMEETSMKNAAPFRSGISGEDIEHPPVFLNLFLLFSANYNPVSSIESNADGLNYYRGLNRLSQVIEFFQGKSMFSIQNSPVEDFLPSTAGIDDPPPVELQTAEIRLEMVTLSFEQINYLWGSLGGKQLPFVMYKASLVPIRRQHVTGRGSAIQDIQGQGFTINRPTP
jgi:hypothetical protein